MRNLAALHVVTTRVHLRLRALHHLRGEHDPLHISFFLYRNSFLLSHYITGIIHKSSHTYGRSFVTFLGAKRVGDAKIPHGRRSGHTLHLLFIACMELSGAWKLRRVALNGRSSRGLYIRVSKARSSHLALAA
jgi:hypothetical protein